MNNNSNNQKQTPVNLSNSFAKILEENPTLSADLKNIINSLTQDDINKISNLIKNKDVQKLAGAMINNKMPKE